MDELPVRALALADESPAEDVDADEDEFDEDEFDEDEDARAGPVEDDPESLLEDVSLVPAEEPEESEDLVDEESDEDESDDEESDEDESDEDESDDDESLAFLFLVLLAASSRESLR